MKSIVSLFYVCHDWCSFSRTCTLLGLIFYQFSLSPIYRIQWHPLPALGGNTAWKRNDVRLPILKLLLSLRLSIRSFALYLDGYGGKGGFLASARASSGSKWPILVARSRFMRDDFVYRLKIAESLFIADSFLYVRLGTVSRSALDPWALLSFCFIEKHRHPPFLFSLLSS